MLYELGLILIAGIAVVGAFLLVVGIDEVLG